MVHKNQKRFLLTILLAVVAPLLSAQEQADSLVRLMNASFIEQYESPDGESIRKAVNATFLHNGTYLSCDSSLWYTDQEIINCIGNVRLQQGDTELTSEKLDYLISEDLAQFRGPLVQLRNENDNILRTRILDYNTKDSVAVFSGGAAMRSENGQIFESDEGYYYSQSKLFTFNGNVNMYADSVFVRTTALEYESDPQIATFTEYTDFWREDNMLSAGKGWYDRANEIFFFEDKVHGLSVDQESWSDSLYYYRNTNNVLMLGAAQLQDTTRSTISLSDYLFYEDSLSRVTLKHNAAVAVWSEREGQMDTVYFGADTLVYQGIRKCDIPEEELQLSQKRRSDFDMDPVSEFRRRAAEQAQKDKDAQLRASQPPVPPKSSSNKGSDTESNTENSSPADSLAQNPVIKDSINLSPSQNIDSLSVTTNAKDTLDININNVEKDSLLMGADSLAIAKDSLALGIDTVALNKGRDSLAIQMDSLGVAMDSLSLQMDSLGVAMDSLSLGPVDTTRIGFIRGMGNVKIFRNDMQVLCDSLAFCELDSIARFYKSPMVWNEEIRQYSSDSLFVLIGKERVEKASLQSNAFIAVMEDSLHFDQIRSLEIMAYFDDESNLQRFDALGGVNALFYLKEDETIATVNKVEAKMLYAVMKDGELEKAYYFDSPKNDAYPIVQLPEKDRELKGFNWQGELRPKSRYDISDIEIRDSERLYYSSRPQAEFPRTDNYFPGYIEELKQGLADAALRKKLKEERQEAIAADSLATVDDSLLLKEMGLLQIDSLASLDSLVQIDSLAQVNDSTSVSKGNDLASNTQEDEDFMSEKELKKALRIARRDARWAELDRRDAQKAAEKQAKKDAKAAKKAERLAERKKKQRDKDLALLRKYMNHYQKQKDKDERRTQQKAQSSGKRVSGTEGGGELPTPFEL